MLTEVDKWRQRLTLSSKKRWDDYVPSHLKYSLSSYEQPNLFLCCRDSLHRSDILVEKDRKQKKKKQQQESYREYWRSSPVAQEVKNMPATWEKWVQSLIREDPLEEEIATHSSILVGEFHGQRSLAGYSPWCCKEWGMTERLSMRDREYCTLR